jgi:hypothetical protein
MFALLLVIALLCTAALLPACGGKSKSDEDTNGTGEKGFKVTASLKGASAAEVRAAATFTPPADTPHEFYDDRPGSTPDNSAGGVSANLSPTAYTVALKKLTLLGDDSKGTADYAVFSTEDVGSAYMADFVNDTTFFDSDTYPPAGTYNGIEIEVFYIQMDIAIVIPRISWNEATYTMRGYFHTVGNIQPRDVTVLYDQNGDGTKEEYWINRKMDDPQPFSLVAVTSAHLSHPFDLWADDNFWGTSTSPRDPLTISSTEEFSRQYGTDFRFTLAPGTESLTIPADPAGLYEISFEFNVGNKFTWWEYQANADHMYAVGFDGGYRILFPDVTISMTTPSTTTAK